MAGQKVVTATIATNGTDTSVLTNPGWAGWVRIYAPANLAEAATITSCATSDGSFMTEQSSGVNVGPSAANTCCTLDPAPSFLKVHLGGAAAANRAFVVEWGV